MMEKYIYNERKVGKGERNATREYTVYRNECQKFRHLYLKNKNRYEGVVCNILFIN
jgi:hypothetical protein